MSEARRLLERIDAARRECGDHCNYQAKIGSACEHMDEVLAVIADIPDFLAQPEPAAREAAKPEHDRKELRCSRCWYRFCGSCSHNCPHCHPADTSLAAAALLAQGEALELFRLGESEHFFGCGVFHKLEKECSPACAAARAALTPDSGEPE